ncbi:MAG: AMP-binding protein, partial [Spirochaetaceae bacterium]|nr:AMP-binding protein [Spirochaetaceae bacterium]
MLRARALSSPDIIVQYIKNGAGQFQTKTYRRFYGEIRDVASGLLEAGVKREDRAGIIADNRQEWLASDFGILSIGAVDVPRGGDSTEQELAYVLGFTGCTLVFAENQKQAMKLLPKTADLPALKILITYDPLDEEPARAFRARGIELYHYPDLLELGRKRRAIYPAEVEEEIDKGRRDDPVTIIFTSGTTGESKGVTLTHSTFLHQLPSFPLIFEAKPGDIWLSVLPVWHVFERVIEYGIIYMASGIAYSKPISSVLLVDFQAVRPHWMVSVPRVWESIMDWSVRHVRQQGRLRKSFFDFFVSAGILYNYFRDLTFGLLPNFHGRFRVLDAVLGFLPWLLLWPLRGLG